jgi:hypothetical protein
MSYTYYKIAAFSGGWHEGEIGIEVDSQSVSGNYSIINLVLRARETTNASSYNLGGANLYLSVDGSVKVTDDTIDFRSFVTGTWYTILSKTGIKVYHDTDGSKEIDVKGYCATGVGAGTYNQTAYNVALPTIPRKSSIASLTGSVTVDGTNAMAVSISRASSTFYHTVKFSIGAYSQSYYSVGTSQSYTIPMSWLNAIPNATSGIANCRVTTYDGDGNNLGYVDGSFTIVVPESVVPVVTGISFNRYLAGDPFNVYAKGISKVQATGSTITNQYSATTATYYWYITPSLTALPALYQNATFISAVLGYFGIMYVALKVKDSRGRVSALYSQEITVYPYASPSVTVTGERCDALGNTDPNGDYIKIRFQGSISPVNNDNNKIYTLQFKKTTEETWTPVDVSGLTDYSVDQSYIREASASYTYEVQGSVQDKVSTALKTVEISTASVVMDFLAGGLGMAIGKVAENEGLEIDWDAQFNGDVHLAGTGSLYFDTSSNNLYMTDRNAVSIGVLSMSGSSNSLLINYGCEDNCNLYAKDTGGIKFYIQDSADGLRYQKVVVGETSLYPANDNSYDLGDEGQRFRDINMYGKLYMGSRSATPDYISFDDGANQYTFSADGNLTVLDVHSNWWGLAHPSGSVNLYDSGTYNYFRPSIDNNYRFGSPSYRWGLIYCSTATINTSDAREKTDVRIIEKASELIRALDPVQFKLIDGESGRNHYGFTAQQLKAAMTKVGIPDCAAYIRSPLLDEAAYSEDLPDDAVRYGIRNEELIAPIVAAVQELFTRLEEVENEIQITEFP